jgi:hypothetical protein
MQSPPINFREIREYAGAQHRGFEELSYQLLPTLDGVLLGDLIRHGTPDAGTEATLVLEDGGVLAWQAKYLFALGSGEVSQLDKSFRRALDTHPSLVRYTFILPYDLPSAPRTSGMSAQERFDAAKGRWEALALQAGRTVEIRYVGESRLLELLTRPEHVGRVRYWFDRELFSGAWFSDKTHLAVQAAGPRYTPELNVELPIAFVFDGLGRTPRFQEVLGAHVRTLRRSRSYLRTRGTDAPLTQRLSRSVAECSKQVDQLVSELDAITVDGFEPLPWESVLEKLQQIDDALEELSGKVRAHTIRLRAREERETTDARKGTFRPSDRLNSFERGLWQVREPLHELTSLLSSMAGGLVNTPLLFLTGAWGTGKTHLLCDLAQRRNAEGRPTVIVLGQAVAAAAPWPQFLEQLGLPNLSAEEFLSALDVAAETTGKRALLIVDAINEGKGQEVWPDHLRHFLARIDDFPRVGLVMSCRTNYLEAVLPRDTTNTTPRDLGFLVENHQGFVGEESRALRRFFAYYKLTLPDFPLLVPEFSNPLFLKLLCQALRAQGQSTLPRGSAGFSFLFSEFLASANAVLAAPSRCDFRSADALVQNAASQIAQLMLRRGEEWLAMNDAESLLNSILPGRTWNTSLLNGMVAEGVLAQNRIGGDEVVHFGYQRLADHLMASQLLEAHDDEVGLRSALAALIGDHAVYRHAGLLESLAVLLPERRGCELHELVSDTDHEVIQDAFLASIIWRELDAFPENLSLDYLNSIPRRSYYLEDRVLATLLHVACVPDHPFNATLLHRNLMRRPLAQRDGSWTIYINGADPDVSVVYRLIDWALSDEQTAAADDAASLCAITLCWFFAASDRGLRDKATKALVNLLRSRLHLYESLIREFSDVDDPYVEERLYAAAYGSALACSDQSAQATLAAVVYGAIFADGQPPVHVLLRDYARGVVELAAARGVLPPDVDLAKARPPYVSPWPLRPPTKDAIERRAPAGDYASLRGSLIGALKDFAHYTVSHAVGHFVAPNQRRRLKERREAARRRAEEAGRAFQDSLSARQRKLGEVALGAEGDKRLKASDKFFGSLNRDQKLLLGQSEADDPPRRELPFPSDEAARWIFRRVLELGWTPKRFKDYDESTSRSYDRSRSRVERIGKKYQWIALHDLLARLADHAPMTTWWGEEDVSYGGPWQLGVRDIDPSLLFDPVDTPHDNWEPTWWAPISYSIHAMEDEQERVAWVLNDSEVPAARALLEVDDPQGTRYLTLDAHYGWKEKARPQLDSWDRQYVNAWLQARGYFVPRNLLQAYLSWAREQRWMGRWMPEAPEVREVFLGEWPWHPSAKESLSTWREIESQGGDAPGSLLSACASYNWSREGDYSISNGVSGYVPGSWLADQLSLVWRPRALEFSAPQADVIALDPSASALGPSAALVRRDSIAEVLDSSDLSVVWTLLGEKLVIGSHLRSFPRMEINGVAWLESGSSSIEVELTYPIA